MDKTLIYKFFADFIYEKTGIVYLEKDYYRLDSRLKALCNFCKVSTPEDAMKLFKNGVSRSVQSFFLDLATNNETYFFRDNRPFDAFSKLLERVLADNPSRKINVWSCACSTGQEPYSLVIKALEVSSVLLPSRFQIFASDISLEALEKAKNGIYQKLEVSRGMPEEMLKKYFQQKNETQWQVKDKLKQYIQFGEFNLFKDAFISDSYDIIFCRNVLIYQNSENKSEILSNIFRSLKKGGILFLGNGESLIGTGHQMRKECIDGAFYYLNERDEKAA